VGEAFVGYRDEYARATCSALRNMASSSSPFEHYSW